MKAADFRASLRADKSQAWMALIGVCVALSPANTKIAGAAWFFICLAGAVVAFQSRKVRVDLSDGVAAASRVWLIACAVSAVLATALALVWPDGPDSLHAEYRLLAAAAAVHVIVRKRSWSLIWRALMLPATALACIAALGMAWKAVPRFAVPSNLIPWAVSVALLLCVLLPRVMEREGAANQRRLFAVSIGLGFCTILLSQARGAYGLFVWAPWLIFAKWGQTKKRINLLVIASSILAGVALVAASAWLPSDPMRLREGFREVAAATGDGNYNTSMGARIYNWSLGWNSFKESPWVGIGGRERLNRIKTAGMDLPAAQQGQRFDEVRKLGHVHNQYLHAAMDGGLVGLAATLAVLGGLAGAAIRLHRVDPSASRQMQGLLFMHATAGLTNVNMAHNYYAVMLALAVSLVLLGARRTPGDLAAAADRPEPAAAR